MHKSWPKVIRDPVHDIVPFEDNPCDHLLLKLIDTKEFQRLRRIKHLGMCDLVFPGANHSRFSHAIGVMHVARKMLDRAALIGVKILEEQKIAVLAAALLHDIGHGPFSHAYEKVTGDKHEARTLEIIGDDTTEVHKCLCNHNKDLPDQLKVFFDESGDNDSKGGGIPVVLTQIISSQFDADRFDYLLRDSHMTGTDYGRFDLNWLLLQLGYDPEKKRLFLSRKALSAAEAYIYARYHMYRSVYFHKTTRAAEVMLKLIFKRYKELLGQGSSKAKVPDVPTAVFEAFNTSPSLEQYLALDDYVVMEFFKSCSKAGDQILALLGNGLVGRNLYKSWDINSQEIHDIFYKKANQVIQRKGLNEEYFLISDRAADTPYKPYDPDAEKPDAQIYIKTEDGKIKELSRVSGPIQGLQEKFTLFRYFYPTILRDEIEKEVSGALQMEAR